MVIGPGGPRSATPPGRTTRPAFSYDAGQRGTQRTWPLLPGPPTPRAAPLGFGVADIVVAREQLLGIGVAADPVDALPGVVLWCNFTDPWGNRLGLYQDLSRWPLENPGVM